MTPTAQPASTAQAWEEAILPTYPTPDLALVRGDGVHVWDQQGRRYLDLLAGLAVASTGHAHPRVADAVAHQARDLVHVSNLYANRPNLRLAEALAHRTGADKVAFLNSGGEANELALKLVRRHAHETPGEPGTVLAFEGGFHGRSMGALTLTGQPGKQEGFGPLLPGVETVPYNDPAALEAAFQSHDVEGVFYEPIQGEGGIVPMEPETASTLASLADEHDALLVADEVQTGVGRTGSFLASPDLGLDPDVVTLAKGLASGIPIGATLVAEPLADLVGPGDHGCTFGGGPVASAAALATLEVLDDEGLVDRAATLGPRLADELEAHEAVTEVRGAGLLLGAQLDGPEADAVVGAARDEGLLVGKAGDDVLRLAPPLVITSEHVDEAVPGLAAALREASS